MDVHSDLSPAVESIARAIADRGAAGLAETLVRLDGAGAFTADWFHPPQRRRYTRKLIYRHPDARFIVVGMTWGPGQGSALHDHAGLWGAEIVVDGVMNETAFALLERTQDGRYRFERGAHRLCGKGAVTTLEPPREYHDFGNAGDGVARTLHVYGGDLTESLAFAHDGAGWWNAKRVELGYDD